MEEGKREGRKEGRKVKESEGKESKGKKRGNTIKNR